MRTIKKWYFIVLGAALAILPAAVALAGGDGDGMD